MTLEQKLALLSSEMEKLNYPSWYWPRLQEAITFLGQKWPLHPDNTLHLSSRKEKS